MYISVEAGRYSEVGQPSLWLFRIHLANVLYGEALVGVEVGREWTLRYKLNEMKDKSRSVCLGL